MGKRLTVSQIVQNYIRDYIVNNKLNSGDPLPSEGDIAATLEVSRVSVREAVKVLETLGILEVRHGNGLFVRGLNFDVLLDVLSYGLVFDPTSLKDLLQVRELFEIGMISEVIKNIRQEDIRTCREILADWKNNIEAGRPYHEQDRLFMSRYVNRLATDCCWSWRIFSGLRIVKLRIIRWLRKTRSHQHGRRPESPYRASECCRSRKCRTGAAAHDKTFCRNQETSGTDAAPKPPVAMHDVLISPGS